ncbi:alpha/beta hydrolase [Pseudobacillus badius]|uniref:Carboxylesterase n=2 Tax=Bacillus badius TaxID=1455 RepID=A0ABR5ATU8_BACBA|nr:alpha/beta fold hydrolase [Bacillus badius]KIL72915.1 Carboxylesterase [Bacillus badius]KIL78069.1 Carboxylesterase [Bacillus badius]
MVKMIGCLCIHGFTGAPYEVEPLAKYLHKRTNWKIVVPTLPGHGTTLSLKGITYRQWLEHAEGELKQLLTECETVYVIGFSMGGLIAAYLAEKYPVKKLILLSAAAKYINAGQLSKDIKEMWHDAKKGKLSENELFLRYKNKLLFTPLSAAWQFRKMAAYSKPLFSKIQIPTFIAQGLADGIVPPKSAEYIYRRLPSVQKEIYYVPHAKHHICHTGEKELLFEKVFTFLTERSRVI